MKKETEIEKLTRIVTSGFEDVRVQFTSLKEYVDDGFDSVEKRFDLMDERFDSLEGEVRTTNKRIDSYMAPTLDDHARRIKDLEIAR